MRDWSKTLPNASFSGQPFFVEREQLEGAAREIALHKFAKSEEHDTEDMGPVVLRFRFQGYIVGDSADTDAQAFVALCRTAYLIADLQLPNLGEYQVRCTRCDASASKDAQGKVDIELEFIEAGNGSAFSVTALGDRIAASLQSGMIGAIVSTISAFAG